MAKDKKRKKEIIEETKINTGTVNESGKVLHFVIENQAQFYPTFYKSRATGQETILRAPNQKEEHTRIANNSTIRSIGPNFPANWFFT